MAVLFALSISMEIQAESVVLSEKSWFPQVRQQVGGTCTIWGGVYNHYGPTVARLYGWDASGPENNTKMGINFAFNTWLNKGHYFNEHHIRQMAAYGCPTWDVIPHPSSSYPNTAIWDNASMHRVGLKAALLGDILGSEENLERLKSLFRRNITVPLF